jgi:hypothetical protein
MLNRYPRTSMFRNTTWLVLLPSMSSFRLDLSTMYDHDHRQKSTSLTSTAFKAWYRASQAVSVVGMVICVFLLISWTILPPERTRRHYLSIGLVIGIFLEGVSPSFDNKRADMIARLCDTIRNTAERVLQ